MPKFEVSDGTDRYEITAPDESAAMAAFKSFKTKAPEKPEKSAGIDIGATAPKPVWNPEAPDAAPAAPADEAAPERGFMDTVKETALRTVPVIGPLLAEGSRQGYTLNDWGRGFATGVPIAGGLVKSLDAATNATLAPVLEPFLKEGPQSLKHAEWKDRYKRAREIQDEMDKAAQEKAPILNTVANITGGVAGMLPAVTALPKLFGAAGSLPLQVGAGAASGGVVGGIDAAVRGEDVGMGVGANAVMGAVAPLAARGVGAAVNALRPKPPVVPQHTVNIAGQEVPLSASNVETDPAKRMAAAQGEQAALSGSLGDQPQAVAQGAIADQKAKLGAAQEEISAQMHPAYARSQEIETRLPQLEQQLSQATASGDAAQIAALTAERTALQTETSKLNMRKVTQPQEAGDVVSAELVQQQQARAAAQQAEQQQQAAALARAQQEAAASTEQLRGGIGRETTGVQGIFAADPYAAGEAMGGAVQRRATAAREARTAAYNDVRDAPGEFNAPAAFERIDNSIKQRLHREHIRIDDGTKIAGQVLQDIKENVSSLRFKNEARPMSETRPTPDGQGRMPAPLTMADIDAARKIATARRPEAVAKAMAGDGSDLRALDGIIRAFDDHVRDVIKAGGFNGDGPAVLALQERARALHREYRQTFHSQGPGDKVGKIIEAMVGRYEGQASTPDKIIKLAYGSEGTPGGETAKQVAQRMRQIFGENSHEWAAYKQGLLSHVIDDSAGKVARTPAQLARRIRGFLDDATGRTLSQEVFSEPERAAMRRLADAQDGIITHQATVAQGLERQRPNDAVERVIESLSGANGIPATPSQVVDYLFGMLGNKGISQQLAITLKQRLTPEAFSTIKQGMFQKLTNAGEGMLEFGPQKISQNLNRFLYNEGRGMAHALYSDAELGHLKMLAATYKKMVPPVGSVNTSATTPALAKVAQKTTGNLLAMLGAATHGFTGMAAGWAGQKILKAAANRKGVAEATRLFYGEQPKVAPRRIDARMPVAISQGATQQIVH